MKNYGIPYKGSKNKIAEYVVDNMPEAENFYDLFCGGGAITHCAILKNKYKNYIMNDTNHLMYNALQRAFNGKFKNEDRWISKDEFDKIKSKDLYASVCFSFGNGCCNYAYSAINEAFKKALHYAICFRNYSLMDDYGIDLRMIDNIKDRKQRRLEAVKIIKKIKNRKTYLESLERLERLQSLESLEILEGRCNTQCFNKSYDEIDIKENSVIYCDIPYIRTKTYFNEEFDYDKFYTWCEKQQNPIFISEYWMPEDRFLCIASKNKISTMSSSNSKNTVEKLFVPIK